MIGGADKYMAVCRACYQIPESKHVMSSAESTPVREGDLTTGRQLFGFDQPVF